MMWLQVDVDIENVATGGRHSLVQVCRLGLCANVEGVEMQGTQEASIGLRLLLQTLMPWLVRLQADQRSFDEQCQLCSRSSRPLRTSGCVSSCSHG
jgi:hypothetical protein